MANGSDNPEPKGEKPLALVNDIFTVADFSHIETQLNPLTEGVLDINSAANVPDSIAQVEGNNSGDEERSPNT